MSITAPTNQVPCEYDMKSPESNEIIQHLKVEKYLLEDNGTLLDGASPIAIVTVGIPGSGKSTSLTMLKKMFGEEKQWTNVDPDSINESVFHGSNHCRGETNIINFQFFDEAEKLKRDLIWDTTGRLYDATTKTIQSLNSNGYSVALCIVLTDLENAMARSNARFSSGQSNRNVPQQYIRDVNIQIQEVIQHYIIYPSKFLDFLYVFDNNVEIGHEPILLLERKPGQNIKCSHPELVEKWLGDLGKKICEHRFTEISDEDTTVWSEPRSRSGTIESENIFTSGESYQGSSDEDSQPLGGKRRTTKKIRKQKISKISKKVKKTKKSKKLRKSKKSRKLKKLRK